MNIRAWMIYTFICLPFIPHLAFSQNNQLTSNKAKPLTKYQVTINNSVEKVNKPPRIRISNFVDFAQPPQISYSTPHVYAVNNTIIPLHPTNAGGAVPATVYGQVSTVTSDNNTAYFSTATSVVTDADGNIFVADYGSNQIKKITRTGDVSIYAGNINGAGGSANGQGTAASFYLPDALVMDEARNLYVADLNNHSIRKITPTGLVTTLAGNGQPGFSNGLGTSASFNNPRGLTIDGNGNLYLADQANNMIRKITPAGAVTTVAGNGQMGYQDGAGTTATFNTPTGVEADAAGNLYVTDAGNNRIRKITPAGVVSTIATNGLDFPREVRADLTGNLYVSNQNNNKIIRISPDGTVAVIAGTGQSGHTDGAGNLAAFSQLIGLTLDGKGNLYVADNYFVRKVIISGYTIDRPLPAGLTFDSTTGIISGTPTVTSPRTNYTITAYNGGGSSSTVLALEVTAIPLLPSVITLPLQQPNLDANNNYNPGGTSTNPETPITYTSSNPAVATITPDGLVHVIAPGVSIITANQAGNAHYADALPVWQTLTVVEYLNLAMLPIDARTVCDADFTVDAATSNPIVPITYSSSNPAVATISDQGMVHIVGPGTTVITAYQNSTSPLYVSATPVSQTLNVAMPVVPFVSITADYTGPCAGAAVTFTATGSNYGTNPVYQWKVNNINVGSNSAVFTSTELHNQDKVTCILINSDTECQKNYPATSNPVNVNLVTPAILTVKIKASADDVLKGTPITFTAIADGSSIPINYQWQVNGSNVGSNSDLFTSSTLANGDVITCTVAINDVCSIPAISEQLTVHLVKELNIPNTFTPNGDGINDHWNISGILSYPSSILNVYSRYGELVYQARGYSNTWTGENNKGQLPVATYYYILNLGKGNKVLSGWVAIIR